MDKKEEAKALLVRFFQFEERRDTVIAERINRFRQLSVLQQQARIIRFEARLSLMYWILTALEIITASFALLPPVDWLIYRCIALVKGVPLMPGLPMQDKVTVFLMACMLYVFGLVLLLVACVSVKNAVVKLLVLLAHFRNIAKERFDGRLKAD